MHDPLIGNVVIKDIFNDSGLLVIPANTTLNQVHVRLLQKHGITILPPQLKTPPPAAEPVTPGTNELLVSRATQEMKDIFHRFRTGEAPPVIEMKTSLIPSIQEAIEFPTLFGLLSGLQAKDDYTFRHNIGVAVLSTMIGTWLHLNHDDLQLLTLAAALHDIGKVKIEEDILNKPGKFTDQEYALMKRHTTYGYDILSGYDGLPEEAALVALQHHERLDGHGYPYGIGADKITYFSKIVAVADVFHAMTSNRVYRGEIPFYKVLRQMREDGYGKMDPVICNLFVQRMMELSIGSEVMLSNQTKGSIVFIFPDDPIRPLVQVQDQFYDLRKHSNLAIEKLVG